MLLLSHTHAKPQGHRFLLGELKNWLMLGWYILPLSFFYFLRLYCHIIVQFKHMLQNVQIRMIYISSDLSIYCLLMTRAFKIIDDFENYIIIIIWIVPALWILLCLWACWPFFPCSLSHHFLVTLVLLSVSVRSKSYMNDILQHLSPLPAIINLIQYASDSFL